MSKAQASTCSRCGDHSMEHFKTYSHCFQCLHVIDHSSDHAPIIPAWALEEFKNVSQQFEAMMGRMNGKSIRTQA